MICDLCGAPLVQEQVTYTIELDGKWIMIEHVPARVCTQCGEKLFSPDTVDKLQQIARDQKGPYRILATPVFDFANTI